MSTTYVSVDIECDGPIPGPNSMLSIGAAAYRLVKGTARFDRLDTFSVNLETMEGAGPDSDTAEWWRGQPEAWAACRKDTVSPLAGMTRFVQWLNSLGGRPVFVGYPAAFDFLFVYWYLIKFLGRSPFSFSALDVKTYAMAVMGCDYRDVNKRTMKPYLPVDSPHTHVAVEDAIEQGELFCNLYAANVARGVAK